MHVDIQQFSKGKKKTETKILMNKIKFVSKIAKMQKTLREESEKIIQIKVFWISELYIFFIQVLNKKSMYGDKLPKGLLLEGKRAFEAFKYVKELDKLNESRPQ